MSYSTSSPSPSTLSLSPTLSTTAIISLTTDDFEEVHDLPPPMYTSTPSSSRFYGYDYDYYSPAILHAPRMKFAPLPDEEDDDVPPPYDTYYGEEAGLGFEYDYEPERRTRTHRGTPVQIRSYDITPPSSPTRLPLLPTPPSPASSTTAIVSLLTPSSSSSSSSSRRKHANVNTYAPPSSHSHKPAVQRPRREGGLSIIFPTPAPKVKSTSKSSSKRSTPAPSVTSTKASKEYGYGFSWQPVEEDLTPPPSPPRKRTKHTRTSSTIKPRSSFSSTSTSSSGTFAPCRLYVPLPC